MPFDLILGLFQDVMRDVSPGRLIESFVLFGVIWNRLNPHLKKIENRLAGLEDALKVGFNSGEERFGKIEERLDKLEQKE